MKNPILPSLIALFALWGCQQTTDLPINTVTGKITPTDLGISLIHEHLLVDFIGADSTGYHRWSRDSVAKKVLPYLLEIKKQGVKTFVDCTPAYLGRDPWLLKRLSEESGLHIITNTGYYGAVNNKYLPAHAFTETAQQLADRWIEEFYHGIEGSGIQPGFMKISVGDGTPLSDVHQKLVRAAAIAHRATGMTIASHTGPAAPALEEIDLLLAGGVDPSAFIWVHAQAEQDFSYYDSVAATGAWISLDGVAWDVPGHIKRLEYCKKQGLLGSVLISHDAGWYKPGERNGGEFKPFTAIFEELIPALQTRGFTQIDIEQLLVKNPASAFTPSIRAVN